MANRKSRSVSSRRGISGRTQAIIGGGLAVATVLAVGAGLAYDSSRTADAASSTASTYVPPTVSAPVQRTPADREAELQGLRDVIASPNPITISILGDSTGNGQDEWVALWARDLSATKTVTVHYWGEDDYLPETTTQGNGPAVEIWNGSKSGARATYAVENLDKLQPVKPDAEVINFGHNQNPDTAGSEISGLVSSITAKWNGPILTGIVLQNKAIEPRAERSAENIAAVRRWAEGVSMPTIDVWAAFDAAPDLNALIATDETGVHPQAQGSRLWADVVSDQLNP